MIEIYVGMTLLGLGYLFNQQKTTRSKSNPIKQIHKGELPVQRNVYDSSFQKTVHQVERQKAMQQYDTALKNSQNKIGQVNHDGSQRSPLQNPQTVMKDKNAFVDNTLTGMKVPVSDFVHNNMKPFGRVKQTYSDASTRPKLESFTGMHTYYKPKHEVEQLFKPEQNIGNMNGTANHTQFYQGRYEAPKSKNNTLPFEQVRVGPALNRGYGSQPDGGFQQLDVRDYAMPKTIDELRIGSNAKETYEGRTVDGQKGTMRGIVGNVDKNRVDTYYKNTPDRYFKTTGAFLKAKQQPAIIDKNTNRQDTSQQYAGIAYNNQGNINHSKVQQPHKEQLRALNVGQANLSSVRDSSKEDYGKANILIYSNERDVTSTRTHQGNLTSIVKAVIAPIQDLLKVTKKEHMIENAHEGRQQIQRSVPSKQTVYNPNDVTRTTIKETLISESQNLNVRGQSMQTVYDPNDIARTTIKETMVDSMPTINVKGSSKSTVYNPNDSAKTTIKETTLDASDKLNIRGTVRNIIYDPNDIARTTIKETTLDSSQVVNIRGSAKGSVYDPNNPTRTTIKETTLDSAQTVNVKGHLKSAVYDPNITARTTTKETTLDSSQTVNVRGPSRNIIYDPNDVTRTTIKETTIHDAENTNIRGNNKSSVYDPNDIAKTTLKETMLHNADLTNIKGDRSMGVVYDIDDEAKITIRETLHPEDTTLNFTTTFKKPLVYDPDDVAKTTMKETTAGSVRSFGNVDRSDNFKGGYEQENFDIPETQRNQLTDEYMGNPNAPTADGYKVTDAMPRDTQKQVLSDRDYYGTAQSQGAKAPMSYSDVYNATIDSLKEDLVQGRSPTQSGVKVAVGGSELNLGVRRQELEINKQENGFVERVVNVTNEPNSIVFTRKPQTYQSSTTVLDDDMLEAFKSNPYTKSLNSYA